MTTTSVKDVGSVLTSGLMPGGNVNKAATESFQSVWDSQAGADRATTDAEGTVSKPVESKDDTAKPGDDLRAKDNARKDLGNDQSETVSKADELTDDEMERVAEVVGTTVAELIQQIADTFGVSVEDVQEIMAEMDLEATDLLQSENLSDLLLQVSGADNTLALLTDEQLYADFQALMEQGKAALEQCSEAAGVSAEEFGQVLEQLQLNDEEAAAVADDMADVSPLVEVTTEDDGVSDEYLQKEDATQTQVQTTENAAVAENATSAENGRGDGAKSGENAQTNAGNLVLQTIRNDNAQPQVAATEAPASTWSPQTQDMMQQIMDYMRVSVKPDVSSLEMQLHPASLGTLQIHVASEGGVLTANFVTENEAVKAAIESQMVQLKESFAEQGVKVEAIEVTVQTHQFEQNLEQGRGRQSQGESSATGRATRTRRINLSGLDGAELPEEIEEEDQLTAEMMAANGQTVDYTA